MRLQIAHGAHGVLVVDVVGLLEQLRRGEHIEVDALALVRSQEVLGAAQVALDLHRALEVGEGLHRLELQVVTDIAELQVKVGQADAVTLAGQL